MTMNEEVIELLEKTTEEFLQGCTLCETKNNIIKQAIAKLRKVPEPSKGRKEAEYYISKCSPTDYEGMKLFCDDLKKSLYEAFDYIDQLQAKIDKLVVGQKAKEIAGS